MSTFKTINQIDYYLNQYLIIMTSREKKQYIKNINYFCRLLLNSLKSVTFQNSSETIFHNNILWTINIMILSRFPWWQTLQLFIKTGWHVCDTQIYLLLGMLDNLLWWKILLRTWIKLDLWKFWICIYILFQ